MIFTLSIAFFSPTTEPVTPKRSGLFSFLKIQMPMQIASRVEGGRALWAFRLAFKVFRNGQFMPACSAEDCFFPEPFLWPHIRLPTTDLLMAFIARIIYPATMESDRNPIDFGMVMDTACFLVHLPSPYLMSFD